MGTGSERMSAILTEKTLPRGACPLFQRHLVRTAGKWGQAPSQRTFSPCFPQGATEPVPFFRLPCLQFELEIHNSEP